MAWLRGLPARQSSTLLIGGIEETSASFEARSAPRSYPTGTAISRLFFHPRILNLNQSWATQSGHSASKRTTRPTVKTARLAHTGHWACLS